MTAKGLKMKRRPSAEPRKVTPATLGKAKNMCSARGGLPKDWDDWFPTALPLLVEITGPDIRVRDILAFAGARMKQVEDPTRLIETAQCLALIHYLGNPPPNTIVTSVYGR